MSHLEQYLVPWIVSNIVTLLILWTAYKSHLIGRVLFVLLFGWACWMNFTTARSQPEVYLEYSSLAASWYSDFIHGWFSQHITMVVSTIAIGQGLIAIGMLLKGWWVKLTAAGAIIFLLAIAPLGIGAAFPFSITVSLAAWFIYRTEKPDYLWKYRKLNTPCTRSAGFYTLSWDQ